jgi:hypothetical protein
MLTWILRKARASVSADLNEMFLNFKGAKKPNLFRRFVTMLIRIISEPQYTQPKNLVCTGIRRFTSSKRMPQSFHRHTTGGRLSWVRLRRPQQWLIKCADGGRRRSTFNFGFERAIHLGDNNVEKKRGKLACWANSGIVRTM